jgi:tRNA pseudouridine55 synthase
LNLDKPSGISSRSAVDRVQRFTPRVKIGHAGTLDPLATGVLIVCLGVATRLVPRIQEHLKGYRAGLKLGLRSDTDDITGVVSPGGDPSQIADAELEAALTFLRGDISQVPPKFSAVHVDGRRAYQLARAEREFDLTPRIVHVESIRLVSRDASEVMLDIACGSGTYVRSLIRDLGERLGCGAVMTSLRRTFVGPFREVDAVPLDELTAELLAERLLPLRSALGDEPRLTATEAQCAALLHGRAIDVEDGPWMVANQRIAVLDPSGDLFAFVTREPERARLHPQQVFVRRREGA